MTELAANIHPHGELAQQFTDLAQQKEANLLGMWLFLATEVMLFGAIFLAYSVSRYRFFEPFSAGSGRLFWWLGGINTVVLLSSSLLMALAVRAAHGGDSKHTTRYLLLTILLGAVFLGVKLTEYGIDYHEGLIPLQDWWKTQNIDPHFDGQMRLFFVFYFIMTILHAIHMTIGMGVLAMLAWLTRKGRATARQSEMVEIAGLYWHFVDIVWVFLFPALYLIHRR